VQVKYNDCTLSEIAVLEYLQNHPAATQASIVEAVGKSLRAIKSEKSALQEK
jgi:hypothetical protein